MSNHIFALDIGTQSVTGVLLQKNNQLFDVIDFCTKQHEERAMLDGQIHNVIQVANIITKIKESLEKDHGPLKTVCVAAAGRALKTIHSEKSISINDRLITNNEEVKHLELSAVQNAQKTLMEENDESIFQHYHCVGYSVLHYKIDGDIIGSIIDQTGNKATVEIIATFLPKVVVKSLVAALDRANLTMEALTLEPIAAIDVLIPESMRKLNVALIDVGAGTSDIAITKQGTVTGYSMVPVAGDEITEAISSEYVLDFKIAEKAKQNIVLNQQASVQDILGFEQTLHYEDVIKKLANKINDFAKLLADEIITLNTKAPQAIMLIGGGSLTPRLTNQLAAALQLPENRVAVRGIEAIQPLQSNEKLPTGPEFVTPIAIAISAKNNPIHYITVYVNDTNIQMFEMKQLTVGDALVQAGIEVNKYYGRPGLAMIVYINDKPMTIRGEYGQQPSIYINDKKATVDTVIQSEDHIVIEQGLDGTSPKIKINELIGEVPEIPFYLNDKKQYLLSTYHVNDNEVNGEYIVKDKDRIKVVMNTTIKDFLDENKELKSELMKELQIRVNKKHVIVENSSTKFILNDKEVDESAVLKANDKLRIVHPNKPTVLSIIEQLKMNHTYHIDVFFQDKQIRLEQTLLTVKRNKEKLELPDIVNTGDHITVTEQKQRAFIFQDLFRYIDIDIENVSGDYKLYRNDEQVGFHDEIISGDHLTIN